MKSRFIVGLAVSAVLFILAARHVNLKDLVSLIKDVNLFYLSVSMAFTILAVWLRALRWRFPCNGDCGASFRCFYSPADIWRPVISYSISSLAKKRVLYAPRGKPPDVGSTPMGQGKKRACWLFHPA